jgi:hypothetical protein
MRATILFVAVATTLLVVFAQQGTSYPYPYRPGPGENYYRPGPGDDRAEMAGK